MCGGHTLSQRGKQKEVLAKSGAEAHMYAVNLVLADLGVTVKLAMCIH